MNRIHLALYQYLSRNYLLRTEPWPCYLFTSESSPILPPDVPRQVTTFSRSPDSSLPVYTHLTSIFGSLPDSINVCHCLLLCSFLSSPVIMSQHAFLLVLWFIGILTCVLFFWFVFLFLASASQLCGPLTCLLDSWSTFIPVTDFCELYSCVYSTSPSLPDGVT